MQPMGDIVTVRVKPGSAKGPLVQTGPDGALTIYVRERAVEHLGLPRARITLVAGTTARIKRFRID